MDSLSGNGRSDSEREYFPLQWNCLQGHPLDLHAKAGQYESPLCRGPPPPQNSCEFLALPRELQGLEAQALQARKHPLSFLEGLRARKRKSRAPTRAPSGLCSIACGESNPTTRSRAGRPKLQEAMKARKQWANTSPADDKCRVFACRLFHAL